jgi:hypothetical protein
VKITEKYFGLGNYSYHSARSIGIPDENGHVSNARNVI